VTDPREPASRAARSDLMLVRLATRLLLSPLGFVCGALAGFGTLALISSRSVQTAWMVPEEALVLGYEFTADAVTMALLFAPLMAAPAIVAVLIAEMFSIRSWTYHAVAGAVTALLPWSLAPAGIDGPMFSAANVVAAGVVGGLVHWLIAGRGSGLALTEAKPPAGADDSSPPR
jgi:hypothetical protein